MTSLQKFNSVCCIFNIVICLILLLDNFAVGSFTETEICKETKVTFGRSRSGSTEWRSNLIKTYSGRDYYASKNAYDVIKEKDSFIVYRTNIFRKAIAIRYSDSTYFYYGKIGVFNESILGLIAILFPLTVSLVLLLFTIKYNKKFEIRHALLCTVICLLLIYFYFIVQS